MFKKLFDNTKIQFITLLSILLLSVTGVIIFLIFNLKMVEDVNVYHENLNKITVNTVELKNAIFDFKKSEHKSKFYELKKDDMSELVFMKLNDLNIINNDLLKFKKAGVYEFIPILNQNQIVFDELEENFSLYVNNLIETGNDKYGYILDINHAEERLNINLKDNIILYNNFLKLKEYKINYINTLNPEFADKFIVEFGKFKQNLKLGNNISDEKERRLAADASSEYLNLFKHIYNLHKVLGNEYYSGIYDEIERLCDEVFININELNNIGKPVIRTDLQKFKIRILILIFISTVIIIMTIILLYYIFRKGLYKISIQSKKVVFSETETSLISTQDFFTEISENIDKHVNNLKEKEDIVKQLTAGDYNITTELIEKDTLGQALNKLKETLKTAAENKEKEDAERIIEDKQKEGIAKFGRILRRHTGDIDSLSYDLISELVNYIDADIGGLYIADRTKDEAVLKLRASYAYNEKKILDQDILFGEGLVGTCAVDQSTFYFEKIDEDYIKIVSGFGHAKPESLIVSPIHVEGEVYGVLELAAVRKFNKNDIDFIEILAEDIAYTLSYLLSIEVKEE